MIQLQYVLFSRSAWNYLAERMKTNKDANIYRQRQKRENVRLAVECEAVILQELPENPDEVKLLFSLSHETDQGNSYIFNHMQHDLKLF